MEGASQGLANVIAQGPQRKMQALLMQQHMLEQQAHAGLYNAQTKQAGAHADLLGAQTQEQKARNDAVPQIGAMLSKAMTGQLEPAEASQLFSGLAATADRNPQQLANAFKTIAATISSGMTTNQPLAQATLLGDKSFGKPVNVPNGATLTDPKTGQPIAYGTQNLAPGHTLQVPQQGGGFSQAASAPFPPQQPHNVPLGGTAIDASGNIVFQAPFSLPSGGAAFDPTGAPIATNPRPEQLHNVPMGNVAIDHSGQPVFSADINLAAGHQILAGGDKSVLGSNTNFPPRANQRSMLEQLMLDNHRAQAQALARNPIMGGDVVPQIQKLMGITNQIPQSSQGPIKVNPQTGERIQLINGKWTRIQ